jgi:N6-adenosine-specific RNA methylase IME4
MAPPKTRAHPTYGTAIIDPPWPYRPPKTTRTGSTSNQTGYSSQHYQPLSLPALAALPVNDWVSDLILLWTTGPMIPAAADLIRAWGFEWVTLTYWLKTSAQGHPQESFDGRVTYKRHMGVGYWFRGDVEPVAIAKRAGTPSYRTGRRASFLHPVMSHSTKPDYLHELAEQHFPGPYLELFARATRPGWTCLGTSIDGVDIRDALGTRCH